MISDRFIEFLKSNALAYTLGTRNDNLEPCVGKARGIEVSEDRKHITFLLPEVGLSDHLRNLEENGNVSLNIVSLPAFESYQFKGEYKSHASCNEEQIKGMYDWRTGFSNACREMGYPEPLCAAMDTQILEPAIAVKFEVKEIFEQTPKPGTGNKIS